MTSHLPCCAALARGVRVGLAVAIWAGALSALPAWAAEPASRSARLLWREADSFLTLSLAQRQSLQALHEAYDKRLQVLRETERPRAAMPGQHTAPSNALCQQAGRAHADWLAASRGVLTPAQLERLAQLEAAFALLPIIESAQAAGLLDDRLLLPPRGLPEGQVAHAVSWLRVPAAALPGCPPAPTTVMPELERQPPEATAPRPRP
jgi:hypothetical protein